MLWSFLLLLVPGKVLAGVESVEINVAKPPASKLSAAQCFAPCTLLA